MADISKIEGLTERHGHTLAGTGPQDQVYAEVMATYGAALERLAKAYQTDPDKRADLLQEVHIAIWKSLEIFDGRCSLRTWLYRVAHNVALRHLIHRRKRQGSFLSLDEAGKFPDTVHHEGSLERHVATERIFKLIHQLRPLDRQVMLLYLEGLEAHSIAEVTGISPGNVAIRIHRIKAVLTRRFHAGGPIDD